MKKILLLSDTHSYWEPAIEKYLDDRDEIWHAGDIGSLDITEKLERFAPVKAVYGNIDDAEIRKIYPKDLRFQCEYLDVWITHIGGYPGRYKPEIKTQLKTAPPKLFICGHSHILKVMYDREFDCLHMNPGAVGNHGFHKVKTMIRFDVDRTEVKNVEVIELGKR